MNNENKQILEMPFLPELAENEMFLLIAPPCGCDWLESTEVGSGTFQTPASHIHTPDFFSDELLVMLVVVVLVVQFQWNL